MNSPSDEWQLLVISLPTNSATARMRIWRALKALGCSALRDGAYLLPRTEPLQSQLGALAVDTTREGGSAWLLSVTSQSAEDDAAFKALFNRNEEYAEFTKAVTEAGRTATTLTPQDLNKALRKLRRDYEVLRNIDYFPDETSAHAEAVWMDFVNIAESILSSGEPQTIQAPITRLVTAEYQEKVWATRHRLWVDRVASAWLIRRFIDPTARFLWLESPGDCPAHALGFDFDGARFTHVGDRVTFEVLMASFGLDNDRGLQRLGALVHTLDMGNGFVPEAAGFEAMLAGVRQRAIDDDQLLNEISPVLEALHLHFSVNANSRNNKED
jgi:hypothetical protein